MADDAIPAEVRQFLARYIQTVEQLEILLLVSNDPGKCWTISEVYSVIRSSEASVAQRLETFTAAGFLQVLPGPPVTYQYQPVSGELRSAVAQTAVLYQNRRVRMVEAIFTSEELDPVQGFAAAFKLRKQ
jgi:hypothetical protein